MNLNRVLRWLRRHPNPAALPPAALFATKPQPSSPPPRVLPPHELGDDDWDELLPGNEDLFH